jgi:hypothetical protein
MERPSQPPLSSLGAEKVTLCLSVGRRGSRPKAKAEDVEPRNSQWERSMPWDEQKTTLDCAIMASTIQHPGVEGLGMLHTNTACELGRPCRLFREVKYG